MRFIGFMYRPPLTGLIGDIGNTFYTAAYAIYTFALIISSAALPAAISKLISERIALGRYRDAHELFKNALGIAVVIGAAAVLFMAIGANWLTQLRFFNYPEAAYAVRALAPTIFVVAILTVFRGYFQGMNTMVPTAVSQVIEQIFNAIFSIWLAHIFFRASRVEHAAAGAAAGTGIGAVAGLIVVLGLYLLIAKHLRERATQNLQVMAPSHIEKRGAQIKAILYTALPIIIGMGIYSISTIIDIGMAKDRIMYSGFFTEEQVDIMVGQFTGKFILLTALPVSLSVALSQAIIPEISSAKAVMDRGAIKHKINTAMRISMTLSIPAAVGLAVLADPILVLLMPSHPEGGQLLRFGSISIVFLALVQVSSGALQGIGKVRLPVIAAFCGVLIKIPINWYLLSIQQINIFGVIISTIVCYIVAAAINLYFLYKYTGVLPDYIGAFLKPAFAAAGMGFACFAAYHMIGLIVPDRVATVLTMFIGLPAYVALLWLVGGIAKQDVDAAPLPGFVRKWFGR